MLTWERQDLCTFYLMTSIRVWYHRIANPHHNVLLNLQEADLTAQIISTDYISIKKTRKPRHTFK